MSRPPHSELTVTSYAILGLLGIKPWTTYELAQQMHRSMRYVWPRAASRIYEEPKRLVALGLARASDETTGRRPRTVYSITPKGRRALASWLGKPGAGPQLEFELILKMLFAEHGTRKNALETIAAIKRWADERTGENITFARELRDGRGPFPDRAAQIVLVGRFVTDFADMVATWAVWADGVVSTWPDEPVAVPPDRATIESIASRTMPETTD